MTFLPQCRTTTIGSYPYTDPDKIAGMIFEKITEIPNWAQLPNLNFRESMYIQYSENLPCIVLDSEKGRIYYDTTGDIYEKLDVFYEKYIDRDLEYFRIGKDFSAGFYAFEELLKKSDLSDLKYVKGQTTGPISFGLTVTDQDKKAILYNEGLSDSIVKSCAMKSAWQIDRLKKTYPNVIMFIDEPYLSSFGSAFINLTREQVIMMLDEMVDMIHEYGALAAVHCCGNTDWSILMDTKMDIINFDAYEFFQGMALYPDHLRRFFERDGILAWGQVPSSDKIKDVTLDDLYTMFEENIDKLCGKGFDKTELLDRCLLTPSCGMGSITTELCEKVLMTINCLSQKVREKYY